MENKFYAAKDKNNEELWLYLGKPEKCGLSWNATDGGRAMTILPKNLFDIDTSTILEVEIREKDYHLSKEGIDMNDQVEVILTSTGAEVLNQLQDELLKEYPRITLKFKRWLEGDKYISQLWILMKNFSSYQGTEAVFTNLKRVER